MMDIKLIIAFSLLALTQSAAQVMPKTLLDKPTGHCNPVCSCQMDSLYYSEGEQWAKPDNPCTVYRCSKTGVIEKVKKGCWYKDKCHSIDSRWTEGCNTFTCTENLNSTFYKLLEAGCPNSNGGCMKVGERRRERCDVLECQVDGTHLKTAKVRTGCDVDGTCMGIDSYWHDGCTVYTCANESNAAVKRIQGNEVMQWPEGNYALLKPLTGCPEDNLMSWSEGSRKHYGAGRNFFSKDLPLAGSYTEDFMKHDFCIHGSTTASADLPKYKTYWEPGSYCILRQNGICPRGFSDGYVFFDDNDSRSKSVSEGVLPDGNYTTNTGLQFCCRKDGKVETEIVLPKDKSFILFMEGGQKTCQAVKGMSRSAGFFTFDGLLTSKHEKTGHTPSVKISDFDVKVTFCHYKPKECGCRDESGQTIAVNTEKEINCVVKRCVPENGKNVIQIVSGGCNVKGKCEPEGSTWSFNEGETCKSRTCQRIVDNTQTLFQIKDTISGCKDGDVCRSVGEEVYRACYTRKCTTDPATNITTFKVIKADCPWLDTCKTPNSTWDYNCMTYRCDMTAVSGHYQWNVQPVAYGCSDGKGRCYKVGENVSGECFDAVCQLSENKTVVFLDVTKGGSTDVQSCYNICRISRSDWCPRPYGEGKNITRVFCRCCYKDKCCTWKDHCKAVNATWTDGCHRFKCEWIDTSNGFTAVVNATYVSCEWNKTCYKEDEVWSDGCIKYQCIVSRVGEAVNWSVKTLSLACKDLKGNCLPVANEVVENCVTYKCRHKGDQIGLEPVSVGCRWNNTCYSENERWNDSVKCVDYQCLKQNLQMGPVMQVSVAGYGCTFNKTCMEVNSTWADGCRTRKCVVHTDGKMIQRSIAPISAGCDDEGICRNVGYKKITDTCMEYECIFNDTYKDAFFSLIGGACRSGDGKCHPIGTKWTEKMENTCLDYECRKEQLGYLSKMIQQKCLDIEGNCRAVGSTGFQASVKEKIRNDCSCVVAPSTALGIAIQCKG